jgi:hypothetical protein
MRLPDTINRGGSAIWSTTGVLCLGCPRRECGESLTPMRFWISDSDSTSFRRILVTPQKLLMSIALEPHAIFAKGAIHKLDTISGHRIELKIQQGTPSSIS